MYLKKIKSYQGLGGKMDKKSFDRINEFCNKQKQTVSQWERDFMWRKFSEGYFSMIEKKKSDKSSITDKEINTIIETLLDDTSLENNLVNARKYYNDLEEEICNEYSKNFNKGNFLKSLVTSILANVLYSGLLIFIFWIAKDQIYTWLTQLAK